MDWFRKRKKAKDTLSAKGGTGTPAEIPTVSIADLEKGCMAPKDAALFREEGIQLELRQKYEEAYQKYEEAAKLNDVPAMVCIARLYLSGNFHPIDTSELTGLLLQENPIFPWSLREETRPDYKSGLEWLTKAADLGDALACEAVGNMLCNGIGCRADVEKGVKYLEKAVANGRGSAGKYICLYRPNGKKLTDEEYESCLAEFVKAADDGDDKAYELYATLKSGTQKQLARLGYVLITAQNMQRTGYEPFKYAAAPSGIPLLPVASKRRSWRTFLRFNLDAWIERYPLIAVASDILDVDEPGWMLEGLHHARIVGKARYKSPEFGWLGEAKTAVVIRLGEEHGLDADAMSEVVQSFALIGEEFQGDSVAFMIENGEKEYSFEVAGINGEKVDVLWRYTIGGSNQVREFFEPELISVDFDPE